MDKITKYQYNSILYLLIHPLFLGIGIIQIIKSVGNDYWISITIGIILGLLINYILKLLPNKNNKVLFLLINLIILLITLMSATRSISILYLDKTPEFIIMIPLLLLIYYSSSKHKTTIFKVSSILILINILVFLINTLSLIPLIKINNLLPIFGKSSILDILLSGLDFALISTLPYFTLDKFKENYNFKTYLFSSLTILTLFILIIGSLGIEVASIFSYPEYIALKQISILDSINNIQNIVFISWFFSMFILMGICTNNIIKVTNQKMLLTFLIITLFINSIFNSFNFIFSNIRIILILIFIIFIVNKFIKKEEINSSKDL